MNSLAQERKRKHFLSSGSSLSLLSLFQQLAVSRDSVLSPTFSSGFSFFFPSSLGRTEKEEAFVQPRFIAREHLPLLLALILEKLERGWDRNECAFQLDLPVRAKSVPFDVGAKSTVEHSPENILLCCQANCSTELRYLVPSK